MRSPAFGRFGGGKWSRRATRLCLVSTFVGEFSRQSLESFDHTPFSRKVESGGRDREQSALALPEERQVNVGESRQCQRFWLTTRQNGALDVGCEERELQYPAHITAIVFGAHNDLFKREHLSEHAARDHREAEPMGVKGMSARENTRKLCKGDRNDKTSARACVLPGRLGRKKPRRSGKILRRDHGDSEVHAHGQPRGKRDRRDVSLASGKLGV